MLPYISHFSVLFHGRQSSRYNCKIGVDVKKVNNCNPLVLAHIPTPTLTHRVSVVLCVSFSFPPQLYTFHLNKNYYYYYFNSQCRPEGQSPPMIISCHFEGTTPDRLVLESGQQVMSWLNGCPLNDVSHGCPFP